MVFLLGARAGGRLRGWLAATVLSTMLLYAGLARMAMMDAAVTLGITGGVAAYWMMQDAPRDRTEGRRSIHPIVWCVLGGVAVGWGLLAKSILGLLPGVIALAWMITRRDFSLFTRVHAWLLVGLLAIVATAGPWYYAIFQAEGAQFLDEFWGRHNVDRFSRSIQGHSGPFYYYLIVFIPVLMPWGLVLGSALSQRRRSPAVHPWTPFDTLALLWAVVPFVILSLMATKLPHYLAPTLPGFAFLLARELHIHLSAPADQRLPGHQWVTASFVATAAIGLVICVATIIGIVMAVHLPVLGLLLAGGLLLGGGLWASLDWAALRRPRAVVVAGAMSMILFVVVQLFVAPGMTLLQVNNQAGSWMKQQADAIAAEAPERPVRIHSVGYFEPSIFYYSGGVASRMRREELRPLWDELKSENGVLLFVMRGQDIADVEANHLPPSASIADTLVLNPLGHLSEGWQDLLNVDKRLHVKAYRLEAQPISEAQPQP
jgi:4-amino-4-deoxy-L-arabinose transferase-like glycosyltransferase